MTEAAHSPQSSDGRPGDGGPRVKSREENGMDLLKEFVLVMHDVIPVLDQMKSTIEESSSTIPQASTQLHDVAQATETATVEILNVLDSISGKITLFEMLLTRLADRKNRMTIVGGEISRLLGDLGSGHPAGEHLEEIRKLWKEYFELTAGSDILSAASKALIEVKNETTNIALALQVQDITSQQIAGVVHLIESVRKKLGQALSKLDRNGSTPASRGETADTKPGSASQTFDQNAQFTRSTERQNIADDIINQWNATNRPDAE